ncbi:hypothetical protein L484_014681 [Morus notabilis]|uniref:Uncharacterized protein n=1 Tax=Morus notabilis TaxID=981085 RepID=W9SC40_9ROSA|nr:hypothetical protein L484_014681 [Morus notabilis]
MLAYPLCCRDDPCSTIGTLPKPTPPLKIGVSFYSAQSYVAPYSHLVCHICNLSNSFNRTFSKDIP